MILGEILKGRRGQREERRRRRLNRREVSVCEGGKRGGEREEMSFNPIVEKS